MVQRGATTLLYPRIHIYVRYIKVKMREEKRWLRHDEMASAIFYFGCKIYVCSGAIKAE